MRIRKPAVAGRFYSGQTDELAHDVEALLREAPLKPVVPKALIVPHAGYIYSGPIAAIAYNTLKNIKESVSKVVLLGPSHRYGFKGVAVSDCDMYQTPMGDIPVDTAAVKKVMALDSVSELPQAHMHEHSLEVQLPFLQQLLGVFTLLPLVVGDANAVEVAEILQQLWGGNETLIIISSDLSHFNSYKDAQVIDKQTTQAIESLSGHLLGEQACGCRPINGLLLIAKEKGLQVTTLGVKNSGDTAGDKDQVVGYGAYAIH